MKQGMIGWQWHQLLHMQIICTLLQKDNSGGTSSLNIYSQVLFLMPNQQCQSTEDSRTLIFWFFNTSYKPQAYGHCSTNYCCLSAVFGKA